MRCEPVITDIHTLSSMERFSGETHIELSYKWSGMMMNLQYFLYTHLIAHDDNRRSNSVSSQFLIFLKSFVLAIELFNDFHIFDYFFAASKVYICIAIHCAVVQILNFHAIFPYLASYVHFQYCAKYKTRINHELRS